MVCIHPLSQMQYIEGRGKLVDAHTVDVGGKRVTARHILSEQF